MREKVQACSNTAQLKNGIRPSGLHRVVILITDSISCGTCGVIQESRYPWQLQGGCQHAQKTIKLLQAGLQPLPSLPAPVPPSTPRGAH